jgi:hypothetical protein
MFGFATVLLEIAHIVTSFAVLLFRNFALALL